MSGFSDMALPGRIPTAGSGRGSVTPEALFGSAAEKESYRNILNGSFGSRDGGVRFKRVKVNIFDLSDAKQVRAYEKLWRELLEKVARQEVIVDTHKDLVQRENGTSYWMKYVEYAEFDYGNDASASLKKENEKA